MNGTMLEVNVKVEVTDVDIDDIMAGALEGGVNYWCRKVEVVEDEYLGEFASEQISRGGSLKLYDREEDAFYILTKELFLNGLKMYLEKPHPYDITEGTRNGYRLDTCMADAVVCDMIIQYALFGQQIYA